MPSSKELRQRAWNSLKGKYWNAFLAGIIIMVIAVVAQEIINGISSFFIIDGESLNYSFMPLIFSVLSLMFIQVPLELGGNKFFIKNTTEKPEMAEIFSGYNKNLAKNVLIYIWAAIKIFLWMLLLIVPGIIKAFEYAIIPYILAENPDITSKEAFSMSKEMMKGNKWNYFALNLSFIGWILLAMLTFGIGLFFLLPYINAALAEFYVEVKNQ